MRRFLIAFFVLILIIALEHRVSAKDQKDLRGLWQAVSLERNGMPAPETAVKGFQILIEGDQLVFNPASGKRKHSFLVNADAKPATMDLTPLDEPGKGQKQPCAIYELEGDSLTICIDKEGQPAQRPKAFKTVSGDGLVLMKLERVKKSE